MLLATLLMTAWAADIPTAQQKIDLIQEGKIPRGSQVTFPERELNVYVQAKSKELFAAGVREPRIEVLEGRAVGTALINFVELRHAQAQDLNWILRKLLEGERTVKAEAKIVSANGKARVDLERVEINGSGIQGRALDLLLRAFVLPLYPNAKVGEEFELGYEMESLRLHRGMVRVSMKPAPRRAK
ncbi:MAG: hypothetical protein HYZ37_15985 [Candidatus Solibacter usitatus]|nr:hypothetical protein [Candidatus Solibacter usitatus]